MAPGGFPQAPPASAPGYPQAFSYPAFPGGVSAPPAAPGTPRTDTRKLEEELAQAKHVVKVLVQMLVERGLIDGEELKRRLRVR